jgi:hypothetical protein
MAVIGIEEVFEATMASGFRPTTGSSAAFFSTRSSTTDSTMIRAPSAPAISSAIVIRSRAASTSSGVASPCSRAVTNPRSIRSPATSGRRASTTTSCPPSAYSQAICEPISPGPRRTIFTWRSSP